MKMGSNPPLIHGKRERGRGRELWCVNGCSHLSHPGLFFSSLTQQSISSLLEGLVLDSSWHVPPSLRARDEGARCAECSNIAHTHLFATWGEKENWRENVKVRQGERGVDKNEDGQNGEKRESKCKKMIIKFHVSVELEFPSQISYRPFGKHETYSEPNDCRGKSST